MKQVEFGPTQRLERAFEQGIRAITRRVTLAKSAEQTFQQWIAELIKRSQAPDVQAASELLATRMVHAASKVNYRTWREAAARSTQSRQLYAALQAEMQGVTGARVAQLIRENAKLISSLPIEAAQTLTNEVTKAQQSGARPATVSKMMRKRFPELLRSRVHLISRTEASKASSSLTQARSEMLNLPAYIWESSHDQRVRKSHKLMNGVVCFWADPPNPEKLGGIKSSLGAYNVGDCPNDRCTPIVVLTLDDIKFPARVHIHGRIVTMTKVDFKKRFNSIEELDAA